MTVQNFNILGQISVPGLNVMAFSYSWQEEWGFEITLPKVHLSTITVPRRRSEMTRWRFRNSPREYVAGRMRLIPAGLPVWMRPAIGPNHGVLMEIEPSHFHSVTGLETITEDQVISFLEVNDPTITMITERCRQEVLSPGFASAELVSSLATCLMIESARMLRDHKSDAASRGGLATWQLKRIREVVEDMPSGTPLTIQMFAERCGISGRHLVREFKAATGTTVHAFIEAVRLERTKRMLEDGHRSMKEIAGEAGFSSVSHLSAAFKRLTGLTPTEYRLRHRDLN